MSFNGKVFPQKVFVRGYQKTTLRINFFVWQEKKHKKSSLEEILCKNFMEKGKK